MEKQRLFVDMDGTLAVFKHVPQLETLYEPGYFEQLPPIRNVVQAVREIIQKKPDVEVFILSSVLTDSKYALQEKNAWLDKNLPEINRAHRIFPPCGQDKAAHIPGGVRPTDCLLDDYTNNLNAWCPPGLGIKLLNGINHTQGTWVRAMVNYEDPPHKLASDIMQSMTEATQEQSQSPEALPLAYMDIPVEHIKGPKFENLISTYEELFHTPVLDRTTAWHLHLGAHQIMSYITPAEAVERYKKALQALGMDNTTFQESPGFEKRCNIVAAMCERHRISIPEYVSMQMDLKDHGPDTLSQVSEPQIDDSEKIEINDQF